MGGSIFALKMKKKNIDFPKSLKLDKIPQNTLTQFSSWPGKQPGRQMKPRLSIPHAEFRGKTTARPCDINAHVAGTTTINIEILSDTSKLLRNEPPYLQGMETYILYASNVIFPHFGVSIQIIFHPRHRPHSASVRPDSQGPMFVQRQSSSRGGGTTRRSTTQTQPHTHTHALNLNADAVLRVNVWSLQDVWKLKRFIGWCSNYQGPTVAFFSRSGIRAEKWILNVLAFLHAHRPVVNYVPRKCFNNSFLPSLHHIAWEAARWISTPPPGFWVILVNRVWYSHCMTTGVCSGGRRARLLITPPHISFHYSSGEVQISPELTSVLIRFVIFKKCIC